IDNGPYMTDIAQDNALIDGVCYETQLEENISILLQADLSLVKAGNLVRKLNILNKLRSLIGKFGSNYPVIAVVSDSGMITLGESKGSGPVKSMGSESLNKLLDKVSSDRKVRALVLRVLSPGGSAVASDLICKKLEEISQTRPVVISMSDVAASGGYLLSLGADKIVADSMTITGSIGVVSGKFNLGGLYNKLGITKDYVVKAKNALMFTSSKDFSEDEEAKLLEIMEFYYTKFVGRVSDSRKMGFEQAESFSKGRVWTGNQAKENGLVDELGTIQTAINIAKEKAEISETSMPVVKFYCEPRGVSIASLVKDSSVLGSLNNIFAALNSLTKEKVLTIMPYDIDIR
ncbi:MAG: signal peptide peptidase SppA, partial [Thermodesulfobacteriota bacterium]